MSSEATFIQEERSEAGGARRLWKWVPSIVLVAVFVAYFVATRSVSAVPGWMDDYQAAAEEARVTGKPMVVAFHSRGCPPCNMMDRMVLGEDIIQKALTRFVPVRLDVAKHPELAAKYEVIGTPTYALLAPDGSPIAQTAGYIPVENFLMFLKAASKPEKPEAQ